MTVCPGRSGAPVRAAGHARQGGDRSVGRQPAGAGQGAQPVGVLLQGLGRPTPQPGPFEDPPAASCHWASTSAVGSGWEWRPRRRRRSRRQAARGLQPPRPGGAATFRPPPPGQANPTTAATTRPVGEDGWAPWAAPRLVPRARGSWWGPARWAPGWRCGGNVSLGGRGGPGPRAPACRLRPRVDPDAGGLTRRRRGGLVGRPTHGRAEIDLGPHMRVGPGDAVAAPACGRPGGEPDGDARGQPVDAGQDAVGGGELLAEPGPGGEEERLQRVGALRRGGSRV